MSNMRFLSKSDPKKANRHAVILAGGDGTRLRSLTRAIAGDERPKQFCPILGEETLLDKTRQRTALGIAPENTHFSLTRKHEQYYERPLWNVPEQQMTVQPENRGTGPAILYSLMRLAKASPGAVVAFFPSDHYFSNDVLFMNHVDSAFSTVDTDSQSIVLLGIEPEKAETAYGWIEPARPHFGGLSKAVSRVSRFWEKPTASVAKRLLGAGCLWNSFVMVGKVETFLDMFRKHLPEMFRMFAASTKLLGSNQESAVIRSIYSWIEETNFSSEVLEKCSDELLVMCVGEVGWCDWGEPERVVGTLMSLGVQSEWMQALAG
jgi:mannose-1-phosphate guanylyltransferase